MNLYGVIILYKDGKEDSAGNVIHPDCDIVFEKSVPIHILQQDGGIDWQTIVGVATPYVSGASVGCDIELFGYKIDCKTARQLTPAISGIAVRCEDRVIYKAEIAILILSPSVNADSRIQSLGSYLERPDRDCLIYRYGKEQGEFVSEELDALIEENGDSCIDNHRVAAEDEQDEVTAYNNRRGEGCCGSEDGKVTWMPTSEEDRKRWPEGRVFLIGFNYGH